mmetsp:Transcript_18693/g.31115  ORF Transcript_18693/g.31115 Transcript_18693/m.31115 type:complete len:425 (-) Transcript_18693:451-1725(-)|eukprot:CAMPEP_0184335908 /NCGR_PEP_ID=MMETSP1089-20130417/4407_1 /TAXON_ID=38269 ORGANISM="Gloeochaete wittrockiana, Strain SAG46.84" /NCGR_SAMPLE_ID=MMETSP1089 /ASSEMBLY_ACC=CAM_ASM_000445 /LENGTH=424 /DNA_ID=CAMNT_0026660805 /DNA_START=83 /DNA_END=1357 /DNA_ORIENTATION=+
MKDFRIPAFSFTYAQCISTGLFRRYPTACCSTSPSKPPFQIQPSFRTSPSLKSRSLNHRFLSSSTPPNFSRFDTQCSSPEIVSRSQRKTAAVTAIVPPSTEPPSTPPLTSQSESPADVLGSSTTETDIVQQQASPFSLALLNFVAIIWGSQHAVIKSSLETLSPGVVNLSRFVLGALMFSPFITLDSATWLAGTELGLYTFAGYAFQAVGLQYTTASRSAFLLYLNVKLVPILSGFLFGKKIELNTWVSAAIALTGTLLLAYDGQAPNVGDAWSIAAALASALFIIRLEKYSSKFSAPSLNFASLSVVAILSAIWVALIDQPAHIQAVLDDLSHAWQPVLYLGVVTTALSNLIQTIGQRSVSAEKAAIIYSLDPVYGALFSYWLLDERLGAQGVLGAILIMVAAGVTQGLQLRRTNPPHLEDMN